MGETGRWSHSLEKAKLATSTTTKAAAMRAGLLESREIPIAASAHIARCVMDKWREDTRNMSSA